MTYLGTLSPLLCLMFISFSYVLIKAPVCTTDWFLNKKKKKEKKKKDEELIIKIQHHSTFPFLRKNIILPRLSAICKLMIFKTNKICNQNIDFITVGGEEAKREDHRTKPARGVVHPNYMSR